MVHRKNHPVNGILSWKKGRLSVFLRGKSLREVAEESIDEPAGGPLDIRDWAKTGNSGVAFFGQQWGGGMKNKSCMTNLEFLDRVTTLIDEGDSVDVIYLDFSKAFDKVYRNHLLDNIKAHNIRGIVYKWISGWLIIKRQRTVLNGSFSKWCQVFSGLPQGSVFGPLAFIIFNFDLDGETSLILIINKFAEDTKLSHKLI